MFWFFCCQNHYNVWFAGREGLSGEETLKLGSYNALLQSSLPKDLQAYKADEETFESSHELFRSAFPRGFAWEVIKVYSGPPEIAFKFRHWGFFEGPYKEHAPTGKIVQFYGVGTLKVLLPSTMSLYSQNGFLRSLYTTVCYLNIIICLYFNIRNQMFRSKRKTRMFCVFNDSVKVLVLTQVLGRFREK